MARYIVRRLVLLIPVLIVISMLVYALLVALPGDPLDALILGDPNVTRAEIEYLKDLYGVNDPLPVQYAKWAGRLLRGDFGFSRAYKMPVTALVVPRMRNTVVLASLSLAVAVGVSIPLGIFSALRQYSWADYLITILAFVGFAVPNFWLGLVLIIVFSVQLGWLPPGGIVSPDVGPGLGDQLADRARFLIMPIFVLSIASMAQWTRYMRSSVLEVLHEEFVLTARAKGLHYRLVVTGHVVRNALIPVVTLMGNTIPIVLGGSIIIETVFAYPGMGKLLYDSVLGNDFSVAMAILMFLAVLVLLFNLAADVAYGFLDPRIRYE